jgi:hypothetical protein
MLIDPKAELSYGIQECDARKAQVSTPAGNQMQK